MSRLRSFSSSPRSPRMATVFAACGSSGSDSSDERPEDGARRSDLQGIESADVDLEAEGRRQRRRRRQRERQPLRPVPERRQEPAAATGHERQGERQLGGKDIDFEGGLVLLPNKAYVNYEGDRLRSRPDDLQLRRIGDRRGAAAKAAPKAAPRATACQEEAPASSTSANSSKT